jgi:hypothetical protein
MILIIREGSAMAINLKKQFCIVIISILFSFTFCNISAAGWSKMNNESSFKNSGITFNLNGIWGSSGTDVFAVGDNGIILHYNGSKWSQMDSGTATDLLSVWGSSASDIYTAGDDGFIFHYNGSVWSKLDNPISYTIYDIWGSSKTDIFFSGPRIYHYDGSGWLNMYDDFWGFDKIWGSSGTDVFAVRGSSKIIHYDGNMWSEMDSGSDSGFYALWGSSSSNVYFFTHSNYIVHFDGMDWDVISLNDSYNIYDAWGSSNSDIFAVTASGEVIHYNGSTWSEIYHDTNYTDLNAVWGSSGQDVFFVGDQGLILHYGGQSATTTTVSNTTTSSHSGTTTTIPGGTTTISGSTTSIVFTTTTTSASISTTIPSTSTTTIELKADFVRDKASGPPPLVVQFTDMSSGNITSYSWDFGDKGTSTERNPSHTYLSEGTYTVSLRVEGDVKADDEVKSGYITVKYNSPTTTTVPAFCPFNSYVGNYEDKETIRMFRDNISKTPSGLLLISLYYKNISEISQILIHNYELRNCFQQLVIDKTWIAKQLVIGQKAIISRDIVNEFIDFLNKLKKHGSPSLQSDIDLVISILDNDSLQKEIGIITIR